MAYKRIEVKLDNIISEPRELVASRKRITEVIVSAVAGPFQLAFSNTGDKIDVASPITFQPTGDEQFNGLWLYNPTAQAGKVLVLYVVFGDNSQLGAELEKV